MKNIEKMQIRDAFIYGVIQKAQTDKDIVLLSNDFGAPALDNFRANYPDQFINAGISEQNIISVAAGMASAGKKVFVYSIASFISLRCLEQIKLDICIHNAPVTIMAGGTGLSYAEDGPTHHAIEDISLMRSLAGMEIYSPADAEQAYELAKACTENPYPAYIRLDKGNMPSLKDHFKFEHDGFRTNNINNRLLLLSYGFMTHRAIEVAEKLESHGIESNVVDISRITPLPTALINLFSEAEKVVTIEEHALNGGLGSIIAEQLIDNDSPAKLKRCAITQDLLYTYGTREKLHQKFKLDSESLLFSIIN